MGPNETNDVDPAEMMVRDWISDCTGTDVDTLDINDETEDDTE